MILKGIEAVRYFAKPDPSKAGLLIAGVDAMRVALRRQEVIAALIGPQGEGEMRLTRLAAASVRKDAATLIDAIKAQGFFPGPRVVFLEDATDAMTPILTQALKEWRPGDAQIVVTAGALNAKSPLKSLFEKAPNTFSAMLYDDPPSREEIEDTLKKSGLTQISAEAMADLSTLARALDPGDFRQTVEKIALYKFGDPSPLTPADVAEMAPATLEAEVDDLLHAVAEGRAPQVGLLMQRLSGQGVLPVTICIQALRHFRALHMAITDPGGIGSGLMKARVFGPRRDQMQRQAQSLGPRLLETAVSILLETDLTLRSSSRAPAMAVMERALIRLAMLKR